MVDRVDAGDGLLVAGHDALSMARSPAMPPPRRAGKPTRRVSGFTRCGAARATPRKSQDPDAEQQDDPHRAQPVGEHADGDGGHGTRDHDDGRLQRVSGEARGGSVEPSRTARVMLVA